MPQSMPIYPKNVVITTLSTMMSLRTDRGEAPMALRMPNSRVRSFTVMSIMLLTPTMPESSVNRPITYSAMCIMRMPLFICKVCVKRFHIHTALSSSGAARWLRFSLAV